MPTRPGERAIDSYRWLARSRTLLIDAYWPPLNPRLEYDATDLARACTELNANAVRFGTAGKYALVPDARYPAHPDLAGRDLLQETIDALRPVGVKTIGYVPVSHGLPQSLLRDRRPEWALRLDDGSLGKAVQHFGGEPLCPTCPFGPYQADILDFIDKIVNGYDISSLYLDGPYYDWNMGAAREVCQCPACRQRFKQDTGGQLATQAEIDAMSADERTAFFERFDQWTSEGLGSLLKAINTIAKQRDLPVMFNVYAAAWRTPAVEKQMIAEADGFLLESDFGGLKGLALSQYEGKIAWRYTRPHNAWPRMSTARTELADADCGYETIAWGGAPIVSYGGRFTYGCGFGQPIRKMFDMAQRVAQADEGCEPFGHIGLIELHRQRDWSQEPRDALAGAYLALHQQGLPVLTLPRDAASDIDTLRRFPVVMIPSLLPLTDTEQRVLRDYISEGGGFIVAGRDAVAMTAAPDLFGVARLPADDPRTTRWAGLAFWDRAWDVYVRPDPSLGIPPAHMAAGGLLPVDGPAHVVAVDGVECLAVIIGGDADPPLGPGVVVRSIGRGKIATFTFDVGRAFSLTGEPGLAGLLGRMADRLSSRPSPCRIDGADGVIASVFSGDGKALIHLRNPTNRPRRVTVTLRRTANAGAVSLRSLATDELLTAQVSAGGVTLDEYEVTQYDCLVVTGWDASQGALHA